MYHIIGGDGKQYGPISGDDIRKWIAEGRLNERSSAKTEAETEFRALATFPEFAALFGINPSIPPLSSPDAASRHAAEQAVKIPAILLIVTAAIELIFGLVGMLSQKATMETYSKMPQFNDPQMQQMLHLGSGPLGMLTNLFQLFAAGVVLVAGIRMLALKNYAFVFTGAVLAVIPCITPCCGVITLPFGIWALVVLNKRDVKVHFE